MTHANHKHDLSARKGADHAYEARRKAFRTVVSIGLSPAAHQRLKALCEEHGCCKRDAIEALLFGTIPGGNPERLSPDEVAAWGGR